MAIIKCPECGESVSSMAGTCPHCGVKIADNLKKCPNCGGLCLNSQETCPTCHAGLSVVTSYDIPQEEPQTQSGQIGQETPATEEDGQQRKSRTPLYVSIALAIIAIIAIVWFFNYQNKTAKEEADYERLENVTNPEFYQQFLLDYPNSVHYQDVKERMEQLQAETADWNLVMNARSRDAIVQFLNNHPESARKGICEDMLDSIDWDAAKSADDEDAVANYLQLHPEGRYVTEAEQLKSNLAKTKVSDQDKSMIRGILDSFFTNALAKQDAGQIGASIAGSTMESFNGTSDATPDQIAAWAKKKMESDVIGLHYLITSDLNITKEEASDGSANYVVGFSLEETINRSDATQPNTNTYRVNARLNSDRKIIRMDIK